MINQISNTTEISPADDFLKLLECPSCGQTFSKGNKPLLLKCGDNICHLCHKLNLKSMTCLICRRIYKNKDNLHHPINFLLLEIIEKSNCPDGKKKTKRSKSLKRQSSNAEGLVYNCTTCGMKFRGSSHTEKYPDHTMIEIVEKNLPDRIISLKERAKELMTNYQESNDTMEKKNENLFKFLHTEIKENMTINLDQLDDLDVIQFSGLINNADMERMREFIEFLKNQEINEIFSSSNNFDDMFRRQKTFPVKMNKFISALFYFYEINRIKLQGAEEKFSSIHFDHGRVLFEDLIVKIYDSLNLDKDLHSTEKFPTNLHGNQLLVFDTESEELLNFEIGKYTQGLEKFSYLLQGDFSLYLTGGMREVMVSNQYTIVNLKEDKVTSMPNMNEARHSHSMIIVKSKVYVIGGFTRSGKAIRTCERFNESHWENFSPLSFDFKNKPILLNYRDEKLYAFDTINKILCLDLSHDKWSHLKPLFKTPCSLDLRNFAIINNKRDIFIFGGEIGEGEKVTRSSKVYTMRDEVNVISEHGNFEHKGTIDSGFIRNSFYILEHIDSSCIIHKAKDITKNEFEVINKVLISFLEVKENK